MELEAGVGRELSWIVTLQRWEDGILESMYFNIFFSLDI
jgi:hypothetical protein